jgi:hypothetical protein
MWQSLPAVGPESEQEWLLNFFRPACGAGESGFRAVVMKPIAGLEC